MDPRPRHVLDLPIPGLLAYQLDANTRPTGLAQPSAQPLGAPPARACAARDDANRRHGARPADRPDTDLSLINRSHGTDPVHVRSCKQRPARSRPMGGTYFVEPVGRQATLGRLLSGARAPIRSRKRLTGSSGGRCLSMVFGRPVRSVPCRPAWMLWASPSFAARAFARRADRAQQRPPILARRWLCCSAGPSRDDVRSEEPTFPPTPSESQIFDGRAASALNGGATGRSSSTSRQTAR